MWKPRIRERGGVCVFKARLAALPLGAPRERCWAMREAPGPRVLGSVGCDSPRCADLAPGSNPAPPPCALGKSHCYSERLD